MTQNYLDAMSLCKWFGYPDFFITFTCNPKWPEVKRFLQNTSLNPEDRPDILCRLFKIKLDALIKDIRESKIFGIVQGGIKLVFLSNSFVIMIIYFFNFLGYFQIYFIQYKDYLIYKINLQWSIRLNFKKEVCHIVIFVCLCMLTPSGLLLNILI